MSTHALDVEVDAQSPKDALAAARALSVEAADPPSNTSLTVRAQGAKLFLRFEASETRSLRAAVHSYLRLAHVALATARRASPRDT